MRRTWMIVVLAFGLASGGCVEMALVGAGAAGGYIYHKGQQSGGQQSERSAKSGAAEKSGQTTPAAPTQPAKTSD